VGFIRCDLVVLRKLTGSSGKRNAETLAVTGGSSGKRTRIDHAADEGRKEGDGDGTAKQRQSPDENAQPGNGNVKGRIVKKPAGERPTWKSICSAVCMGMGFCMFGHAHMGLVIVFTSCHIFKSFLEIEWWNAVAGKKTAAKKARPGQDGPTDSELDIMSDAEDAATALAPPKKTPPSKGKQSKALKVAAAVQGALAQTAGKLPEGTPLLWIARYKNWNDWIQSQAWLGCGV